MGKKSKQPKVVDEIGDDFTFDPALAVPITELGAHVNVIDLSHPNNAARAEALQARSKRKAELARERKRG